MGCNGSKSVNLTLAEGDAENTEAKEENAENVENASTRPVTPQPVPPSMAFDIPFNDEASSEDPSIVKKHPPKRLQRLEEIQQNSAPISLEDLQEKQQEAERRRQEFLQLRAQSAKRKYAMRNNNNAEDGEGNVNDEENENTKIKNVETTNEAVEQTAQ